MQKQIRSSKIGDLYRLLKGSLAQRYSVLDYSWGLLMTLTGLCFAILNVLIGCQLRLHASGSVQCWHASLMPAGTGVSLGPFLFGGSGFYDFQHEFGHTVQNRWLGPFFIPVVALPSLLSALRGDPVRHASLYCERWADAWSYGYNRRLSLLSNRHIKA